MMKMFEDSPSLVNAMYVARTLPPITATPAMITGRLTHTLTLEPQNFGRDWTVLDLFGLAQQGVEGSGCRGTIARPDARCSRKSWRSRSGIADAVRYTPHGTATSRCGEPPHSSGRSAGPTDDCVQCKARLDQLIELSPTHATIVDLKTAGCSGPYNWAKHCWDYGYRKQAAWYRDAVRSLGFTQVDWVYIVARKIARRTMSMSTWPTDEELAIGERENREILAEMADMP